MVRVVQIEDFVEAHYPAHCLVVLLVCQYRLPGNARSITRSPWALISASAVGSCAGEAAGTRAAAMVFPMELASFHAADSDTSRSED